MTAAYRLRGLGWFATCSAIVLGFYLVSLQVASERNKLDALNASIRAAERDVRALETEFDTRANLRQLERWNGDVLALSAPTAGQFVPDEARLAAVSFDASGDPKLRTAALVVPAFHDLPQAVAAAAPAAPPAPAPVRDPAAPVASVRVAAAKPAAATPGAAPAAAPRLAQVERALGRTEAAPRLPKLQRVAMLDRQLLSPTTFGDLMSGARAESGRRR